MLMFSGSFFSQLCSDFTGFNVGSVWVSPATDCNPCTAVGLGGLLGNDPISLQRLMWCNNLEVSELTEQ